MYYITVQTKDDIKHKYHFFFPFPCCPPRGGVTGRPEFKPP